jgi:MFS family permease
VGRALAPFLGGYILFATNYSYQTLYLAVGIAGVTAFLMTVLFLAERRHVSSQPSKSEKTVKMLLHRWKIIAGTPGIFAASLIQAGQYYAYGAVEYFLVGYLRDIVRLDALLIGVVMGSQVIAVILAKPLMGRVSDRIGRRIPIVLGSIVTALPLLGLPFSNQFFVLLALSMVYGVGFAAVTSSTPALVSELAPTNLTGTAMGYLDMTMDIGQTIGPLVTGMIIATVGYKGSFPALTAVLLLLTVVFILLKNPKDGRASLEKTSN